MVDATSRHPGERILTKFSEFELSSVAAVKRITKRLHGNTRLLKGLSREIPNPKVDIASLKVDVLLLRTLPGTVLY